MKLRILLITFLILVVAGLAGIVYFQGCEQPKDAGKVRTPPPESMPLWQQVELKENPRAPQLEQNGGDMEVEGFGEILGFHPVPEQDWQIIALDWEDEVVGVYILDLHAREIIDLGAVHLEGPRPTVESYVWPWVLLQSQDESGNFSWVLVDVAEGEIVWEDYAWVPPGLRNRPVWYTSQDWFMGPISGPVLTNVLSGETVETSAEHSLNPVKNKWPAWCGGRTNCPWYIAPAQEGGSTMVNLVDGRRLYLEQDQNLSWNGDWSSLAWIQDGTLGLTDISDGRNTTLNTVVPASPRWSSNSDKLYFLGGQEDYLGTVWDSLWSWEEEAGVSQLFSLPGNWVHWRLLAVADEAVLALAGEGGESLVYFDVPNQEIYELGAARDWQWDEGNLVAVYQDELIRVSPGAGCKVLDREAEDIVPLDMVNQFLIYAQDGLVYIMQLVV